MSHLDAVRRSYEAFARGDMDGVVADMHPEIEWQQAQGLPHGGTDRGLDEVRRHVFDPLHESWWDEFAADPDEFLEARGHVVVLGRYRGVGRASGRPLAVPYVHVWTFRGGKAVRFRQFLDTAGWNKALAFDRH